MENKDFVIEEEVFVRTIPGYDEVPYRMECYDGYANGTLLNEDKYPNAPKTIRMEYLTRNDVLNDRGGLADNILYYRGLYDLNENDITYGDIMMYLGEIVEN
jgi:hypothetical protein